MKVFGAILMGLCIGAGLNKLTHGDNEGMVAMLLTSVLLLAVLCLCVIVEGK